MVRSTTAATAHPVIIVAAEVFAGSMLAIFRKDSMGLEKYCGQYIFHLKACPVTVAGAVHRSCIAVRWPWSGVQKQHLTAMFRAFDRKHKSMYNWRFSRFRLHLRRAGERKFLQFFR